MDGQPLAATMLLLGILNGVLAWLVWRSRPRGPASKVLTALIALNALLAAISAAGYESTSALAFALNVLTFVPLAVLPMVFPTRRFGKRWEALVALLVLVALMPHIARVVGFLVTGVAAETTVGSATTFALTVSIIVAFVALLFLDAYLGASTAAHRDQARFGLAAVGVKLGAFVGASSWLAWAGPRSPYPEALLARSFPWGAIETTSFAVWHLAFYAILLGIAVARVRQWRRDGRLDGVRGDLFVLGALAGGIVFARVLGFEAVERFEYLLVRPLLLAYGIFRLQIVPLDLPRERGLLAAGLVSAIAATYLIAFDAATSARLTASLAQTAALVASLIVGGALLVPALVHLAPDSRRSGRAPRRLDVYEAVLEAARADDEPTDASRLRAIRAELGVTQREHESIVAKLKGARASGDVQVGDRILSRYRVDARASAGSQAQVYLGEDERLGRPVAIKALRAHHGDEARLQREARALASLRNDRIVTIYDVEASQGRIFVIMERVEGGSLADRLARGPLLRDELRVVGRDLLHALAVVHATGGVHRDVKPSNVLLTRAGRAKLADFGIAQLPGDEETVAIDRERALGTLRYMSPEQAKGHRVGAASDLYSAAATLFEATTGDPYVAPRARESAIELQMRVASAGPFDRNVGDAALDGWFARALHPDPAARFTFAGEMADALDEAFTLSRGRS